MAAVFTVVMMASIGVPGLNGFVSEFLVLAGTFITPPLVGGRRAPSGVIARGDLPAVGLPAGVPRRAQASR